MSRVISMESPQPIGDLTGTCPSYSCCYHIQDSWTHDQSFNIARWNKGPILSVKSMKRSGEDAAYMEADVNHAKPCLAKEEDSGISECYFRC